MAFWTYERSTWCSLFCFFFRCLYSEATWSGLELEVLLHDEKSHKSFVQSVDFSKANSLIGVLIALAFLILKRSCYRSWLKHWHFDIHQSVHSTIDL